MLLLLIKAVGSLQIEVHWPLHPKVPSYRGLKKGVSLRKMAFDGFDYFCDIPDERKSFVALWKEEVLLAATFPWGINPFIFCF